MISLKNNWITHLSKDAILEIWLEVLSVIHNKVEDKPLIISKSSKIHSR